MLISSFRLAVALTAATMTAIALPVAAQTYETTVVASGLNNPRGLAFGPNGALYIAESGTSPVSNPFTFSSNGAITRVLNG